MSFRKLSTSSYFNTMMLLRLVTVLLVAARCCECQGVDDYYSRNLFNGYNGGDVAEVNNPKSFFDTCIKVRDSNNFFSEEEKFHHPILPPPTSFARDSRFDNNNNNYNFNNSNNNTDYDDVAHAGNKDEKKPYVPEFLLESQHCTDYKCMALDLNRDPRQLGRFTCYSVIILMNLPVKGLNSTARDHSPRWLRV